MDERIGLIDFNFNVLHFKALNRLRNKFVPNKNIIRVKCTNRKYRDLSLS